MTITHASARRALCAAVFSAAIALPSFAQAQSGLDTIVVTAQKREENQQEVPISVETLSAERLSNITANGDDIVALAAKVPGLYAESSNGRLAPRFYIRGLGNVDFDLAASQPVSVIVDDIVQENVLLKSAPLFDVDQVEVSRGPQGTLFGRNTPAGIVKFITRKPTDEFEAIGQFAYSSYDTVTAQAAVGGPLIEDVLAVRVSGLYQNRDDYIDNHFTGEDNVIGGYEEIAGRVQLLFTPTDDVSLLLNAHARDHDGTSGIFRANLLEQGTGNVVNFDRDGVAYDSTSNNRQITDGWGGSAKLEWDLGLVTLTAISGYETADSRSGGDIDGGFAGPNTGFDPAGPLPAQPFPQDLISFPAETFDSIPDLDQYTQEVRIASNNEGPFNWQAGFYYFDTTFQVQTDGPAFPPLTIVEHKNDSWAVFGQGTYDITDRLNVTAGIRYTEDNREFDSVLLPPGVTVNATEVSDDDVSWDVSVLYKVNPDFNLYARVARGFRGPTIQGRDVAFAAFSDSVDPQTIATSETIQSYEAGFKSLHADNRLRLNAAVFYYEIDDQQFSIIGGAGNLNQVINADKGVGFGFEIDAEYLVADNLLIGAGFGFADTEIQDDDLATATCGSGLCTVLDPLNGLGQALIDGNPFPNAPEYTLNGFVEYTHPLSDHGELFANTDWTLQGDTNFFLYRSAEFQTSNNFEGGVRLGYRSSDGGYEAALFARNITDEVNVKGGIDFNNLTGFTNEPRVFGFQLTVRQ